MGLEDTAADIPMTTLELEGVPLEVTRIEIDEILKRIRKHRHKPDQRRKRIKQKRQKRTIKRNAIWESDYKPEWSDTTQGLAVPLPIIEVQ